MSENGAENLRRLNLERLQCAEIVFHAARNSLENQAFVPTGLYMAGCRGLFKAKSAKAPQLSRFDLNWECMDLRQSAVAKSLIGR
jgi:hypothetical protein